MKKLVAFLLALTMMISGAAMAEPGISYEGTVVAGQTMPVSVPYGGRVRDLSLRQGDWVQEGDTLAAVDTTLNFAPVEGTIAGLYAEEGDATEAVTERYGALLYIEPTHRYTLDATSEKAYNSSENYFVHLGERVYLTCTADGSHQGTGIVSALTDTGYTVEVTGGDFYLSEKVDIYRDSAYAKESRIGRGTVARAKPVAVKGSGSVLKLHVANGDFVERGELLFETVEGTLDGLYAPGSQVLSPATGVIASVEKNAGDTVAKGDILAKISPANTFQVAFQVPEADLFTLREGQKVTMELYWDNEAGETFPGTIASISHMNVEQSGSQTGAGEKSEKKVYSAYVNFQPDERVRLGMTMIIYPLEEKESAEENEPEND